MGTVNFTSARIQAHTCPNGKSQSFIWDQKTPGLGLRATASGSKAFIFQAKLHGKSIRLTIGDPRSWTTDDAQKEARRLQQLVDAGKDPREVSAEEKIAYQARQAAAQRKNLTFGDAWNAYLEDLKSKISPKTKQPRSAQYIEDHLKLAAPGGQKKKRGKGLTARGPLHSLINDRLSDLTGARIAEWMAVESAERPTSASYAYRMLKAMVRWCDDQVQFAGLIPSDCYSSAKVKAHLPGTNTTEGDSLQREQLRAWFKAVCGLSNPVTSVYLQGLLINGPRREELAALRWDDVDFQWGSIHLHDKIETKTGRTIPLTPYFGSLLRTLKHINDTPPSSADLTALRAEGKTWEPSPWVFASPRSATGHIEEPRYAHEKALEAAQLPHVSLQGLRRSFGTLSEWCEVPVGVVAQIQGHKPSALAEKHYRRRPLDMLRMWHEKIEVWMLKEAGIKFESKSRAPPEMPPDATC